jgi:glycosyltransferase involved in cell wall biosynthesis
MGPQDGVDLTIRALHKLVHEHGRTDCGLVLLGFGDCLEDLKNLASSLNLDEHVTFAGRVGQQEIAAYLSTADIGLCPDPKSPLNDVSTMNKTMEYMAYALPVVTFDLTETRVSAAEAACYVEPGDLNGFVAAWANLIDDADARLRLGRAGRERVSTKLDWAEQAERYVGVYRALLGAPSSPPASSRATVHQRQSAAHADHIDLDDEVGFAGFIRNRGRD